MSNNQVSVEIPAPDIQRMMVEIEGDAPLIFHQWSEKAKKMMRDKHAKKAGAGKKSKREPIEEYKQTFYLDSDGYVSFPARCIKQAIVGAGRQVDGIPMTLIRGAIFVVGDKDGMIQVKHADEPIKISGQIEKYDIERRPEGLYGYDPELPEVVQMREDPVTVGRGSADLRYRGQVRDWTMKFMVRWNADVFSAEQVLNLLQIAGFSQGLGDWRPECDGHFGVFSLCEGEEEKKK